MFESAGIDTRSYEEKLASGDIKEEIGDTRASDAAFHTQTQQAEARLNATDTTSVDSGLDVLDKTYEMQNLSDHQRAIEEQNAALAEASHIPPYDTTAPRYGAEDVGSLRDHLAENANEGTSDAASDGSDLRGKLQEIVDAQAADKPPPPDDTGGGASDGPHLREKLQELVDEQGKPPLPPSDTGHEERTRPNLLEVLQEHANASPEKPPLPSSDTGRESRNLADERGGNYYRAWQQNQNVR